MATHYQPEDAVHLSAIIRNYRPRWAHKAIMAELGIAAKAGATLGQVTAAAERAMKNEKNMAPPSINFPENWEEPKMASKNLMAPRLCAECATRFPADQVSRHPSGHGFICNNHEETA